MRLPIKYEICKFANLNKHFCWFGNAFSLFRLIILWSITVSVWRNIRIYAICVQFWISCCCCFVQSKTYQCEYYVIFYFNLLMILYASDSKIISSLPVVWYRQGCNSWMREMLIWLNRLVARDYRIMRTHMTLLNAKTSNRIDCDVVISVRVSTSLLKKRKACD